MTGSLPVTPLFVAEFFVTPKATNSTCRSKFSGFDCAHIPRQDGPVVWPKNQGDGTSLEGQSQAPSRRLPNHLIWAHSAQLRRLHHSRASCPLGPNPRADATLWGTSINSVKPVFRAWEARSWSDKEPEVVTIEDLVQQLVEREGSDLHLGAGTPPMIRIHGRLIAAGDSILDPDEVRKIVYSILDNEQVRKFEKDQELDMAFGISGLGRFRTNVFFQRGSVGAVLRVIPNQIPEMSSLGLPQDVCEGLCLKKKGLVLITGATGSGKSTTLASMIDSINQNRNDHIVTIEDPIEFVHRNRNCLVTQREVENDTPSFSSALRRVLRQDPDVIMVGELRDLDSISGALTIAETGHLTFGTLHTNDAVQSLNRLIDVFPPHQQQQIRTQLSFVLEGIFCQQLVTRSDGRGRVLACEVLLATPAVRALIRDDKVHQIPSAIQTGGKLGMKTMNQSLYELYRTRQITYEEAISRATDSDELKRIFQRQS